VYSFLAVFYSYVQQTIGMGVPVVVSFDYIWLILTDTVGVCVKLMVAFSNNFLYVNNMHFDVANTEHEKHIVICPYVEVMSV
jgi:hypothetical protein